MKDKLAEAFQSGFEKAAQEGFEPDRPILTRALELTGSVGGAVPGALLANKILGPGSIPLMAGALAGGGLGAAGGHGLATLAGETSPPPKERSQLKKLERSGYDVSRLNNPKMQRLVERLKEREGRNR